MDDARGPAGPVLASWQPDRKTYVRDHALMAVIGGIGATGVLFYLGNADAWVGFIAALLAIGVRGWYLASDELGLRWDLTADAVSGSNGKRVALHDIEKTRRLGSAVQMVTRGGDKHLMKYLPDPAGVCARIDTAVGRSNG